MSKQLSFEDIKPQDFCPKGCDQMELEIDRSDLCGCTPDGKKMIVDSVITVRCKHEAICKTLATNFLKKLQEEQN